MRIRILGAGFYGCHIGLALKRAGHDVEIHEIARNIFAGASGGIPARLHLGAPHYPRSLATRQACMIHNADFMAEYGFLTRAVPVNIYAIASDKSLIDFGTYKQIMAGVEFLTVHDPAEFGLQNVEGAIQVAERHIVTGMARDYFDAELADVLRLKSAPGEVSSAEYDWTIDCTFCANDSAGVDRYEPCLVMLVAPKENWSKRHPEKAVTIMDGPFPSLYPWDKRQRLHSLSSARWTPFSKTCKTWAEARALLDGLSVQEIKVQCDAMVDSMAYFYPEIREYALVEHRLSIRAMPLSSADTRLVDVVRVGERALRVRAGKIDAIIAAEKMIREMIE